MKHGKRRDRREKREEPSLSVLAAGFALKWIYMVYLVTAVLIVLYPVRRILHFNYEVVGNAYSYFVGFPLIILSFVGARHRGEVIEV